MKFRLPFLAKKAEKQFSLEELRFRVEPLVAAVKGEALDKYQVEQAAVFIVDQEGRGYYLVSEPELTPEEQQTYSLLMENLYYSMKPTARVEDPMKYLEGFIWEAAEDMGIVERVQSCFPKTKYYITRDAFGYGPIHVAMMDPDVEEISITGYAAPVAVIHRRFTQYDWLQTNIDFRSEDSLRNFVQRLAQRAGKSVTVAVPFTDAMTKDGHRIAVTFADEVTLPGSTACVRKFPQSPFSMGHLLKFKTLTPLMAAYLWLLVEHKGFIMTIGAMSTGKSTALNCLLTMIDPVMKIATVEDSVAGDSEVVAIVGGRRVRTTVGELIDGQLDCKGFTIVDSGHEVCDGEGVKILTVDAFGHAGLKTPDRLIRHYVEKPFVEVKTATGRSIKVTADHSLFTLGEDELLKPVRCGALKPGDVIAVLGRTRLNGNNVEFSLANDPSFMDRFALDANERVYAPHTIKPQFIPARRTRSSVDSIPLMGRLRETNLYGLAEGDVCFDKVKKIDMYEDEGYVYDFGVAGTESFVCNGFICHNTPELNIPHQSWQRFKARHTYSITEARYDIDLMELVKLGLRYRPDYVVVGEVRGEEVRALVQGAALGHGCLCSIHGESPEASLVRMRSPPMDVAEGGLMLIWCFVLLGRVRMPDGTVVRRVLEVTEVEPKDEKLTLKRMFTWNARNDSFAPESAEEVVKRSYRLDTVKRYTGMTDSELTSELEERAGFLLKTVEEERLTYPDFAEAVRQFYVAKRKGSN